MVVPVGPGEQLDCGNAGIGEWDMVARIQGFRYHLDVDSRHVTGSAEDVDPFRSGIPSENQQFTLPEAAHGVQVYHPHDLFGGKDTRMTDIVL